MIPAAAAGAHSLIGMYTDLNRPPLVADALRRALVRGMAGGDPHAFYSSLDVVTETGSTNADLLARAADSALDRAVLISEFQDHGRGRHARSWVAPPRSAVSVSVLLRMPGIDPADLGWLPLLAGVAVVDAMRSVAEVDAVLKWPNDVLIGGKKVAGILAEVAATAPVPSVVLGIGLNVSLTESELPVPTATSLALAGAATTDRDTVVRALLRALAAEWTKWQRNGWDTKALAESYRDRCATIGQRVRAELPGGGELLGTASGIDAQGRIVISPDGGREPVAVSAGDITHLRPQE
ncbi:BirA family biotin operon repressor/biotin-[acetyl-CoA-carboxylase] ligase [Rhodococcus sp. PvR044]|nr:BirA family biotin operon repressor/biotin-[acetyl-CoA-carboxylase] ligase [Rhodococcus sp. OK611]SNX89806.1 BirA family transcriptional regulator, biotin operon repressor / biotin-[acetyl-CoA-carboxylase] ligase [Rhodococcus sp. OK270]